MLGGRHGVEISPAKARDFFFSFFFCLGANKSCTHPRILEDVKLGVPSLVLPLSSHRCFSQVSFLVLSLFRSGPWRSRRALSQCSYRGSMWVISLGTYSHPLDPTLLNPDAPLGTPEVFKYQCLIPCQRFCFLGTCAIWLLGLYSMASVNVEQEERYITGHGRGVGDWIGDKDAAKFIRLFPFLSPSTH